MSLSGFAYAFAIFIASWLVSHALLMPKPIPGIPYNFLARYMPWGDMVPLGIHFFRTREVFRWLSLQNLHHKSPLVQLFLPSFSTVLPTLVLADLPEIDDIVKKRIGEIDRADLMHTWFGIVAPRGMIGLKTSQAMFREQRRLWNIVLSPKFLDEVSAPCFVKAANELADLWEKKAELAGPNRAFEAQDNIKLATLDVMWEMCTGSSMDLLRSDLKRLGEPCPMRHERDDVAVFAKAKRPRLYEVLHKLLSCLSWVMLGFSARFYTFLFTYSGVLGSATREKDMLLDACIDEVRKRVTTGEIIGAFALDEIISRDTRQSSMTKGKKGDDGHAALRDEVLELLITGHESTASSIAWALKYLTDNPEVQTRLRRSLLVALDSHKPFRMPTAQEITTTSLPYLDAVIAETLRLSNTGPVSFRQAMVPCDILGHHVPAGTPIVLVTAGPSYMSPEMPSALTCERSETSRAAITRQHVLSSKSVRGSGEVVFELDTFSPERWLFGGTFDPHAVHMLPFSTGTRGCFGKNIALLELKIMLAILTLRFEFPQPSERLSGYQAQDGLTSRPQTCYVIPRSRPLDEE